MELGAPCVRVEKEKEESVMAKNSALKPEARRRLLRPPWRLEDYSRLGGLMFELSPIGLWFMWVVGFYASRARGAHEF